MEKAKVNNRISLSRVPKRFWKPINNNMPGTVFTIVAVQANNDNKVLETYCNNIPV